MSDAAGYMSAVGSKLVTLRTGVVKSRVSKLGPAARSKKDLWTSWMRRMASRGFSGRDFREQWVTAAGVTSRSLKVQALKASMRSSVCWKVSRDLLDAVRGYTWRISLAPTMNAKLGEVAAWAAR